MDAIDGMACAKRGCDNRGKLGLNIVGHGSFPTKWGRRWRYRCTVGGGTVSTHTGTAYSGRRCARREVDQVASLRVEGVSMRPISQKFQDAGCAPAAKGVRVFVITIK